MPCVILRMVLEQTDQVLLGAHLPSAANVAVYTVLMSHTVTVEKGQFSQSVILLYVCCIVIANFCQNWSPLHMPLCTNTLFQ